jgi:tetratricopeptide (TPR) repeat protein
LSAHNKLRLARRTRNVEALAASPRSPLAHYAKGQVLRAQGRYKEAIPEYETAIASDSNWVSALSALAECKLHAGPIGEVIPLQEQVVHLSPRDPLISNMYGRIGVADLLQSRVDEAIVGSKRRAPPIRCASLPTLSSPLPMASRATPNALPPNSPKPGNWSATIVSSIARQRVRIAEYFENPAIRALFETTHFAGLRKAGVPEK